MKRNLIPDVPKGFVIPEEFEKKRQGWIAYFKGMSDRIVICSPSDKEFDIKSYEDSLKRVIGCSDNLEKITLWNFPTKEQVAFIVCFDSSTDPSKKTFLTEDAVIFCLNNLAFLLDRNLYEHDDLFSYNLTAYTDEVFFWKHNAKIIQTRLKEIQSSIPNPP